jgi:hypothetical protein
VVDRGLRAGKDPGVVEVVQAVGGAGSDHGDALL